jgi:hypothetical protein
MVTPDSMNLGRSGWGIMIGWTLWVFILPLFLEIFEVLFLTKTRSETYKIANRTNRKQNEEIKAEEYENKKAKNLWLCKAVFLLYFVFQILSESI